MILSKIWEKKIFFNTLKLTLFFLSAIYIVFIIIDFSIHSAKIFSHSETTFLDILRYFTFLFII